MMSNLNSLFKRCVKRKRDDKDDVIYEEAYDPFKSVPIEILEEIFHHIRVIDLLENCRLVSKYWCEIATFICQERYVETKKFETVHDNACLPWSAINMFQREKDLLHKVVACGYLIHIKSFTLGIRNDSLCIHDFLTALSSMHNLQKLQICVEKTSELSSSIPICETSLPKLKQISFEMSSHNLEPKSTTQTFLDILEIFELNIRARPVRTSVYINLNALSSEASSYRTLHKIFNFGNNLGLKLRNYSFNGSNSWWWPTLLEYPELNQIRRLRIDSLNVPSESRNSFRLHQQLLQSCTGLEELQLFGFCSFGDNLQLPNVSDLLQMPILPNLRNFEINFYNGRAYNKDPGPDKSYIYFKPITPYAFPRLENIVIKAADGRHDVEEAGGHIDIQKLFEPFEGIGFECVKFLTLQIYNGFRNNPIQDIFPNLRKLTVNICIKKDLTSLLWTLKNLASLCLIMTTKEDVNVVLSQAFNEHLFPVLPGLKSLEISNKCLYTDRSVLKDSGASHLMRLHPLDLTIYKDKTNISVELISALASYHRFLLLKPDLGKPAKFPIRF